MNKKNFISLVCILLTFTLFQQLSGQVTGTQEHQIRWLSTSALRSWFSNSGAEGEYFRRDRTAYLNVDQIDGLCWPNEFNIRMKGTKVGKSLWIGTTNFADPVSNTTYPYKVVSVGGRRAFTGSEVFIEELSLVGKFPHPLLFVDQTGSSYRDFDDILDREDPNQSADRMIVNSFHTSIGLSVTRKILSFSQQYHDNYYIYEYTFKNTGIIDGTNVKKLDKTLTGVVFYFQNRLSFAGESYTASGNGGWAPATSTWGRNTIHDAVGQDQNHRLPAPNDFRAIFSYWGPISSTTFGSPEGDIGLPGPPSGVWTLAGTQFSGVAVLHADTSPDNPADDINQPAATTSVAGADDVRNAQPSQYNQDLMSRKYLEFMTAGHPSATMADEIGKDANGWPTAYGNTYGTDAGGYMATQGFGPYNLDPGDSVRIVLVEAVAGISREKILEVAENWATNNSSEYYLPNGTLATDRNVYKNTWVFTGKDSLFQTFRRARANYNSNYSIPQPPRPPESFEVNSGGDRIQLSWDPSPDEGAPSFMGYKLYRIDGRTDTTYDLIAEVGKSVHSFDDQTAQRGVNYYYYIQSVDDGSTNPGDPVLNIPAGEPLVSSRYYTMTSNPAALRRQAGAAITTVQTFDTLKIIRRVFTPSGRIATSPADTVAVSSISYRIVLPKSALDSAGNSNVSAVSIYLNKSSLPIPSANYQLLNDTIRFYEFPFAKGLFQSNVVYQKSVVDSLLDAFLPTITTKVNFITPLSPYVRALFVGDGVRTQFVLPIPIENAKGERLYSSFEVLTIRNNVTSVVPSSQYSISSDQLIFTAAPAISDTFTVTFGTAAKLRDNSLSQIRIVPNPFNIKSRNIQFGGGTDPTTVDRLAFYNLPPVCKIKIYTELGDLIETIDHTNGSGDDYWHSLTSSRQVVVSGLYIAYFEVTEDAFDQQGNRIYKKGDNIFKKFIIIR